jgi:hypothetical protein
MIERVPGSGLAGSQEISALAVRPGRIDQRPNLPGSTLTVPTPDVFGLTCAGIFTPMRRKCHAAEPKARPIKTNRRKAMGTSHTCLIHGQERVRLAHELDRICRYEPASTLRARTHD